MITYSTAPIKLILKTDWGEITTYVSTFQVERPLSLKAGDIIPLKALKRQFRLPINLMLTTSVSIKDGDGLNLISFRHRMKRSGDVPEMMLDALVRIIRSYDERTAGNNANVIEAELLRGGFWINPSEKHPLEQSIWPHTHEQPQKLVLEAHEWWVMYKDPSLIKDLMRNEDIKIKRRSNQQSTAYVYWEILNCAPYQQYIIKQVSDRFRLSNNLLNLSVAAYGPPEGLLRVDASRVDRMLKNIAIFRGSSDSTWTPTWATITTDEALHFADSFEEALHFADSAESDALAGSTRLHWNGKTLRLTFSDQDQREIALVGSDNPQHLQGRYLWSYQQLDRDYGWLRWPTWSSEKVGLQPSERPFEVSVNAGTSNEGLRDQSQRDKLWGWSCSLGRGIESDQDSPHIRCTIGVNGDCTISGLQTDLTLFSPRLRLYNGKEGLVDSESPPPLLDPIHLDPNQIEQGDMLFIDRARLRFMLVEKTTTDGVTVQSTTVDSERTINITQNSDLPIEGAIVWTGSPDSSQAWIFTDSIVGRNLVEGVETAWDPHAGKRLVPIQELQLKTENDELVVGGKLSAEMLFQATMALLPWVEGTRNAMTGGIQLQAFHRNLVCEIDEARVAREDRGLLPGQRDPLSEQDRTSAVRDEFASLAILGKNISRANFWPGLNLQNIDLSLPLTLRARDINILPSVQIGNRTMQIRSEASNPPSGIPNHPPDWLNYRVRLASLVDTEGEPNPVAEVSSDGEQHLHTSLLMKDGHWLDHAGTLWSPEPEVFQGLYKGLLVQRLQQAHYQNDILTWSKHALVSGTIKLADDVRLGHSIYLYLESFLVDVQPDGALSRARQQVGSCKPGAWKLSSGLEQPLPTMFGFELEGLSVEAITAQNVVVKAILLSPSQAQTTEETPITLSFPGNDQIIFDATRVIYDFLQLGAVPFPHGGLPGQLTRLEAILSYETGSSSLKLTPLKQEGNEQLSSQAYTLGSIWSCNVPALRGEQGRWSNWSPPLTIDPFWIEPRAESAVTSYHMLHLEETLPMQKLPLGLELEDFSYAGFLTRDGNILHYQTLYEPDIPQIIPHSKDGQLAGVDVLTSRREWWFSPDLLQSGPRTLFLLNYDNNTSELRTSQDQDPIETFESDTLGLLQGAVLIPITKMTTNDIRRGISVIIWSQEHLEAFLPPEGPDQDWVKVHLDSVFPSKIFRIPNQDNQFLVTNRDGNIFHFRVKWDDPNQEIAVLESNLLELPFTTVTSLLALDRFRFVVVDGNGEGWIVMMKYFTAEHIPNSKGAVLTPEVGVDMDSFPGSPDLSSPRLFLAIWDDASAKTVIHHWRAGQLQTTPFAVVSAQVHHGVSTPLGPWWLSSGNRQMKVYNLNDWFEWDKHSLRADIRVDVSLVKDSPFQLDCRISRGNTLAVTHFDRSRNSRSPAWPRQVQGQYTSFSVPSHLTGESMIWTTGLLVLWPELKNPEVRGDFEIGADRMAGVWLRESWEKHTSDLMGTLHQLQIDWWAEGGWKYELNITGLLASSANWTLQLHEQRTTKTEWSLGLLELNLDTADIQLPVRFKFTSTGVDIYPSLYLVKHATLLGSMSPIDLALPDANGQRQLNYDLQPVKLDNIGVWCLLSRKEDGSFEFTSVGPDQEFTFLEDEATSDLPKLPIAVTQLTHRRIFGSRLRFGEGVDTFKASTPNSWNVIGNAQGETRDDSNLDYFIGIFEQLTQHQPRRDSTKYQKEYENFKRLNRSFWNAEFREDRELVNPNSINPGDQFTAWTPVNGQKPNEGPIKLETGRYIGALTAKYDNNSWLFQEPFWVTRSEETEDTKVCLTDNVLVIGRPTALAKLPGVEADPAVECLRSVTDLVGSSIKRGLQADELSSFLLATGSAGVVVKRLFEGAGPPQYKFPRSPFSAGVGEIPIGAQELPLNLVCDLLPGPPLSSPILLRDKPWSDHVSPARYAPALDDSGPKLPVFSRDFRQVRFDLQDYHASETKLRTLLLHEAVCYPNRIHNDPSQDAHDGSWKPTGSFHPQSLDLVYSVDKPGGMLTHSLEPRFDAEENRSRGLTTNFAMRDPRQVIIPPGAAIRVQSLEKEADRQFELAFEEVLGSLKAPVVSVSDLISLDGSTYTLNREAVLLITKVGDDVLAVPPDAPYLPLDKEVVKSSAPAHRLVYLVTRGQLLTPIIFRSLNFYPADVVIFQQKMLDDDFWITSLMVPAENNEFNLVWKSQEVVEPSMREIMLDYYGTGQDNIEQTKSPKPKQLDIRLIPALATPKLAVITREKDEANDRGQDILELFATARGGVPTFKAVNAMIEASNVYKTVWRRSRVRPFDVLHVVKYFADGQTLCDTFRYRVEVEDNLIGNPDWDIVLPLRSLSEIQPHESPLPRPLRENRPDYSRKKLEKERIGYNVKNSCLMESRFFIPSKLVLKGMPIQVPMSKSRSRVFKFLTIASLTAVIIYWSIHPLSAPLQEGLSGKIPTILAGFTVVAALIERATEVVVGIFRTLNKEFEEELVRLETDLGGKDTDEYRAKLNDFIGYRAGTQQLSLLVGFTMAVLLCSAGVGILTSILNLDNIGAAQQQFVRGVDIILTSGLLAGGSQAFHNIVANSIRDAVDAMRNGS
jgi:hypothetical protein